MLLPNSNSANNSRRISSSSSSSNNNSEDTLSTTMHLHLRSHRQDRAGSGTLMPRTRLPHPSS